MKRTIEEYGGKSGRESEAGGGWEQYFDDDGNPYIYHPVAGTSMWGYLATKGSGGSPSGGSSTGRTSPMSSSLVRPAQYTPRLGGFGDLSVNTGDDSHLLQANQFSSPRGSASASSPAGKSPPKNLVSPSCQFATHNRPACSPSAASPKSSSSQVTTTSRPHHWIRRAYDDTDISEAEGAADPNSFDFKPKFVPSLELKEQRRMERRQRRKDLEERKAKREKKREERVMQRIREDCELEGLKREELELRERIRKLEEESKREKSLTKLKRENKIKGG